MKSAVALNLVVAIEDWADTVAVTVDGNHVLSFTDVTVADLDINRVAYYIAEINRFLHNPRYIQKIKPHPSLLVEVVRDQAN